MKTQVFVVIVVKGIVYVIIQNKNPIMNEKRYKSMIEIC